MPHLEGGRVDVFESDGSYKGTDPNDQHVHDAAIASYAQILLTSDGGFTGPDVDPDELPYEVYEPDDFFTLVDDSAPEVAKAATAAQLQYWFNESGDADLPLYLRKASCPNFADRVRAHLQQLPPPARA